MQKILPCVEPQPDNGPRDNAGRDGACDDPLPGVDDISGVEQRNIIANCDFVTDGNTLLG